MKFKTIPDCIRWAIGSKKNDNVKAFRQERSFTRVGMPIRVMTKTTEGWRFSAGQISKVSGSTVDVWVFPCTGITPYVINNIRHKDFMQKGEPWWDFIVYEHCVSE